MLHVSDLPTFLSILNILNQSRNDLQSGCLAYLIWVIQTGLRPLDWTPLNLDGSIMICYAHIKYYFHSRGPSALHFVTHTEKYYKYCS